MTCVALYHHVLIMMFTASIEGAVRSSRMFQDLNPSASATEVDDSCQPQAKRSRQSQRQPGLTSVSLLFPQNSCIFRKKSEYSSKTKGWLVKCLTYSAESIIKAAAVVKNDHVMLGCIDGVD